jgi:hypothetical protein
MARRQEYKILTDNAFERASDEQSAQLQAQWKILGARYFYLSKQSEKNDESPTIYDPIPWDRSRNN